MYTKMQNRPMDEETKLRFDFFSADTIRKRIIIKRQALERGYAHLVDFFLKNLVPSSTIKD